MDILPSQNNLGSRFFKLAIANVISNLTVPLANICSVAFLGHLAEIHHLAGVSLAGNLTSLIFLLLMSLRMSTTAMTAQAVGQNDHESMLLVGLRNVLVALILGIAIAGLQSPLRSLGFGLLDAAPEVTAAAIAYFNAQIWATPAIALNFVIIGWFLGREKGLLVVGLASIASLANIVMDYLFITRWGWESMGAGISYTASQYILLVLGLSFACWEFKWQEVKHIMPKIWDPAAIIATFTLNSNIIISNTAFIITFVVFNYQSAALGTVTYAQNALLLQVFVLGTYIVKGLGLGTETLSGNFKGQGNTSQLLPLVGISVVSSLVVGLTLAGLPILFPQTIFGILTNHLEVVEHIDVYVLWLLPILGFSAVGFMGGGYFLGLGEGHTLRNISVTATLLGFVPADIIATIYYPESNHKLWLALSIFVFVRMVIFGTQIPRTFSNQPNPVISDVAVPAID